jgi:hypothetical protein
VPEGVPEGDGAWGLGLEVTVTVTVGAGVGEVGTRLNGLIGLDGALTTTATRSSDV